MHADDVTTDDRSSHPFADGRIARRARAGVGCEHPRVADGDAVVVLGHLPDLEVPVEVVVCPPVPAETTVDDVEYVLRDVRQDGCAVSGASLRRRGMVIQLVRRRNGESRLC